MPETPSNYVSLRQIAARLYSTDTIYTEVETGRRLRYCGYRGKDDDRVEILKDEETGEEVSKVTDVLFTSAYRVSIPVVLTMNDEDTGFIFLAPTLEEQPPNEV